MAQLPAANSGDYRADIDGLRAIAVMSVVLYHFGLGCPGGYVGVDVFFVISGFLITRVLAASEPRGGLTRFMLGFWMRRIRRLAPALAVTTTLTLIASYPFLGNPDRLHAAWTSIYQLGFAANFYLFSEAGYFGPDAESLLFLHHWSLAVEEQFYLVFPSLLLLSLRRGRRATLAALWLVALSSFALSFTTTQQHPDFSFYLLPTRAWELLAGALLAIGNPRAPSSRSVREVVAWGSLAAVSVAIFCFDHQTSFPGAAAMLPCLGTVGLIYAGAEHSTLRDVLASRGFVWVGLISYSLYLVHWPVSALTFYTSIEEPTVLYRIAMLGASIVAAWASWKFVETPVRRRRVFASSRSLLLGFVASTVAVATLCLVVISRVPTTPDDLVPDVSMQELEAGRTPVIGAVSEAMQRPHLMLWGDSHGQMLAGELSAMLTERQLFGRSATGYAVPPLVGATLRDSSRRMHERSRHVMRIIKRDKPRHVLLVAAWWDYAVGEDGGGDLIARSEIDAPARAGAEVFEAALRETVRQLEQLGVQTWIVKSVPLQGQHVPRALLAAERDGRDPDTLGVTVAEHRTRQELVDGAIDRVALDSPLRVLDPTQHLSLPNGHTIVAVDGAAAYRDGNHITPKVGVPLLRPMLEQLFDQ